jgi:NTE family protein
MIALGEEDGILLQKINRILEEYTPRRFMTEEIKRNISIY